MGHSSFRENALNTDVSCRNAALKHPELVNFQMKNVTMIICAKNPSILVLILAHVFQLLISNHNVQAEKKLQPDKQCDDM